jgi:hypothetical protein
VRTGNWQNGCELRAGNTATDQSTDPKASVFYLSPAAEDRPYPKFFRRGRTASAAALAVGTGSRPAYSEAVASGWRCRNGPR